MYLPYSLGALLAFAKQHPDTSVRFFMKLDLVAHTLGLDKDIRVLTPIEIYNHVEILNYGRSIPVVVGVRFMREFRYLRYKYSLNLRRAL